MEGERDDTYGDFGHGNLDSEQQAIVDQVASGEIPVTEAEVWQNDLQRRTNAVIEEIGGQWFPEGLEGAAAQQVLHEVYAKGDWTIESIVDPSTGDRRTIILPGSWDEREFWGRVNELATEELDPMLRVSEEYRA